MVNKGPMMEKWREVVSRFSRIDANASSDTLPMVTPRFPYRKDTPTSRRDPTALYDVQGLFASPQNEERLLQLIIQLMLFEQKFRTKRPHNIFKEG